MSPRSRVAVLAMSVAGVVLGACSSTPTNPVSELQERIGDPRPPEDFVMTYRSGGTTVLNCVLPNRTFVISVVGDVLEVWSSTSSATLLAIRSAGDLRLSNALFEPGPLAERWLSVDLQRISAPDLARLGELLGPDLASYLLVVPMPPSGRQIADAALDAATSAQALEPEQISGRPAEGYRLQLDARDYREASAPTAVLPAADSAAPSIDIWLDEDDAVARVIVTPPAGGDTSGWVIDFDDAIARPSSPRRPSSLPVDDVDLQELRSAGSSCEVGT